MGDTSTATAYAPTNSTSAITSGSTGQYLTWSDPYSTGPWTITGSPYITNTWTITDSTGRPDWIPTSVPNDSNFIKSLKRVEEQAEYSDKQYLEKVKCCGNCDHCKECICEINKESIDCKGYCKWWYSKNKKENNLLLNEDGSMSDEYKIYEKWRKK